MRNSCDHFWTFWHFSYYWGWAQHTSAPSQHRKNWLKPVRLATQPCVGLWPSCLPFNSKHRVASPRLFPYTSINERGIMKMKSPKIMESLFPFTKQRDCCLLWPLPRVSPFLFFCIQWLERMGCECLHAHSLGTRAFWRTPGRQDSLTCWPHPQVPAGEASWSCLPLHDMGCISSSSRGYNGGINCTVLYYNLQWGLFMHTVVWWWYKMMMMMTT